MSLAMGPHAPELWPAVWKLLRLRLVISFNTFRRASLRRKIGTLVLIALFVAFLGFIFSVSWLFLGFVRSPQLTQILGDVRPFLESVPTLILSGAFFGILLTSFGVLLQAMYLAGDMDFLLSTPLPIRAVFVAKLLQAILPNFTLICMFALPVLFGMGAADGYFWIYYPLVLATLAALALAGAGLSSVLVMVVVRVIPARRVAEVLGFVGAIISFVCSQSGQLMRFNRVRENQAAAMLNLASRFNTPWSPLTWAGRGLVAVGQGDWLTGGQLLITLSLAFVVFYIALTAAERLYYTGWASMQGSWRRKKAPRPVRTGRPTRLASLSQRWIPPAIRAMLVKDFYVLRRDLRNMSQLVTPLIFGIIYAVMFMRGGGEIPNSGDTPEWVTGAMKNVWVYGNVGISLFVGWMLLARLAGMSFSQEGRNYWILKSAPVSTGQLLTAKFVVAFLPTLSLGWAFLLVISALQQHFSLLWFTLPVVALCIGGNTGVNLAFGVLGANLDWEDPRQMQRGSAGCLGSLVSMAYLPVSLVLFFGPALAASLMQLPDALGQLAGLALGAVFCLGCAILPLWLVRARVSRLGE